MATTVFVKCIRMSDLYGPLEPHKRIELAQVKRRMIHEDTVLVLEYGFNGSLEVHLIWCLLRTNSLIQGFLLGFLLDNLLGDPRIFQILQVSLKTLCPLLDFDMMLIILFLCSLVILFHCFKQLLLLCLDKASNFIESFVESFIVIGQLELNLGEDILCMLVPIRGFLMDKLIELLLQDLDLVTQTSKNTLLD